MQSKDMTPMPNRPGAQPKPGQGQEAPPQFAASGTLIEQSNQKVTASCDRGARSATVARVEANGDPGHSSVEVEIRGLSIYTHHGVTDAEQQVGQRLEFDLTFDVPDCDAVITDRLEDTVDYSEVCDIVALAATERSYRTLERLCQVTAERLMERFDCDSVQVRAAKPEPPVPYPVQEAGVEVTLERSLDREPDDEEGV
jgi:dihydroneopterin aldolase